MKNILLTGINARYSHSSPALYYLRSYNQDLGYNIQIIEFIINQDLDEIIDSIIKNKPDCICFSVYIWNAELVKSIIPIIKLKKNDCKIILGGPEVSYDPEDWINNFSEIDHIVTGPGEQGFRELLESGINLTQKVITVQNPHFSKIPFPYNDLDFEELKDKKILYYESSRGCPFKCSYCISSRVDQKLEFKDIEQVKNELDLIVRRKPKIVKFIDRTFNAGKSHYIQIWKYLLSNYADTGIRFHFEIYPALLDNSDFDFLSKCPEGLFQFEVGIQSTYNKALESINRKTAWKNIKEKVLKLANLQNIHIHVDLIAGLPYENLKYFENSFNEIYTIKTDHFQLGILKILKGTQIYDQIEQYDIRYSESAPYAIRSNKWLSEPQINKLTVIAQLIDTLYNTHKYSLTLENLEKLYDSPYDLYSDLADFIIADYSGERSKVWEENAARILNFIKSRFPGHEGYFLDCLGWDWCSHTKQKFYPAVIHQKNKYLVKTGVDFFARFAKNEKITYNNIEFTLTEIKQSLFFKPKTDRFIKEYMKGESIALFLHNNKKIKILF